MKPRIKYGRNLKRRFYIGLDPVQFHYVDLPCYMYYGIESPVGISFDKMVIMYMYKQYLKEHAPEYDTRSKYFDMQMSPEQLDNIENEMERERLIRESMDTIRMTDYYSIYRRYMDSRHREYLRTLYFNNHFYYGKDIQGSCARDTRECAGDETGREERTETAGSPE